MYKNKITYKIYQKNGATMLVIYNYKTKATLLYEDISAVLLYNYLKNNEEINKDLLKNYEINISEYDSFIRECNYLISNDTVEYDKDIPVKIKVNDDHDKNVILHNKMYDAGILFHFHFDITSNCNFRCIHCYHPFDNYNNEELSFDEIEKLFSTLNEIGVFKITLSGGEPFLRNDIIDILKLGTKYNFVFEIFTNGSMLNDDIIRQLSELNVSKLSFSYYGDKNIYHHVTGSNCYNVLMDNVKCCIKYNVDYELKFIAMKCNYRQLPNFFDMAKEYNIRPGVELNITPKLNGDTSNLFEKLDFNDYIEIFKNNDQIFSMLSEPQNYRANDHIQCNAGKYGLYCDFKGNIYPCVSYRKFLGTYQELKNIWCGDLLQSVTNMCNADFKSFNKYSYCDYCYEICPGLSVIEGKNEYECNNSGCDISKAIEYTIKQKSKT